MPNVVMSALGPQLEVRGLARVEREGRRAPASSWARSAATRGCTLRTRPAPSSGAVDHVGPGRRVRRVVEQGGGPGSALHRNLVTRPGQLADDLGDQRHAGLARGRLPDHRDAHTAEPSPAVRRQLSAL